MPSRRSPSQRTPEGRQGRQMASLSVGSNGGRVISAGTRMSAQSRVTPTADFEAIWSTQGPADTTESGPHPVRAATMLRHFTVATDATATGASDLDLKLNGTTIATVTLPSGMSFASLDLEYAIAGGSLLTVQFTTVGSGLGRCTATCDNRPD